MVLQFISRRALGNIFSFGLLVTLLIVSQSCRKPHTRRPPLHLQLGTKQLMGDFHEAVTIGAMASNGTFAAGTRQGKIIIHEPSRKKSTLGSVSVHDGPLSALAFSADGQYLFSAGGHSAASWALPSLKLLHQIRGPQIITAGAITNHSKPVAYFGTAEGHMLRWDLISSRAEALANFACAGSFLSRAEMQLPENRRCPFGTYVEPKQGPPMCAYLVSVLFANKTTVARACREGTLGILNVPSNTRSWFLAGHLVTLNQVTPNLFLLGRADGELRLYQTDTKKIVAQLDPRGAPEAATTFKDFIAIAQKNAIRIWPTGGGPVIATIARQIRTVWLGVGPSSSELWVLGENGRLEAYPFTIAQHYQ